MPILYNEDDLSGKFSKTIYAGHINSLGLVSGIFSSHWQLASIYICYTAGNGYIAQTRKKSQTFFKNLVVVYIAKYPKCLVWCGTKYIHYYFHVVVSRFPHSLKKSRIRETKHVLTDADSSTNTTVGWTKNTQKPNFFEKRKKSSKTQKLKNV